MRPVLQKAKSAPEVLLQEGEGERVEETQVPDHASRRAAGGDEEFIDDGEGSEVGERSAKSVKTGSRDRKKKADEQSKEKEKKTKKVKPEAHANFRKLKIKNKNSKANGRGGRFGRR